MVSAGASIATARASANTDPSKGLEELLAGDLAAVPDVRSVSVERTAGNLLVWVSVDHPTKEIREQVFKKQFELVEAFPEVSFDFNVVSSNNQDFRNVASGAQLIYSREG
jgi:predicted ATPase